MILPCLGRIPLIFLLKGTLFIIFFSPKLLYATTYYDGVYSNGWTVWNNDHTTSTSSGPSYNQNNTFASSGLGSPVYKGLTVNSGDAYLHNYGTGTLTNNISGGLTVSGGETGFYGATNNISGGLTVSGGGTANLRNATNAISGGLTINGGTADLSNYNAGTQTSTIDTVNLNGGKIALGGKENTTTITNLNWSGGELSLL